MAESRWARYAPLAGIVFVALALVSAVLELNHSPSDFPAKTGDITAYYTTHHDAIMVGAWLGVFAIPFLVWFLGALRSRLFAAEGGTGRLSAVMFGAGISVATFSMLSDTLTMAAASRANEDGKIEVGTATTLYDAANWIFGLALPMALAVTVAATAVVALRYAALPRWFAIASAVLALTLVVPFTAWFMTFAGLIWTVTLSVMLYRAEAPARAAAAPPPAAPAPA